MVQIKYKKGSNMQRRKITCLSVLRKFILAEIKVITWKLIRNRDI